MSKKSKRVRFDNVSSEDDIVDMDNMHESQAKAGPSRLANKRVLVLNADYQPLSYKPLSTVPWTQAMFWLVKGWSRVADGGKPIITVVEEYDEVIHTGNDEFTLPSVIAMTHMVPMPQQAPFTRSNIYICATIILASILELNVNPAILHWITLSHNQKVVNRTGPIWWRAAVM